MTESPFIIAGLLDGPWVVIAIVLVGALTNWLNKRREEKAAAEKSNPDSAPAQPQPATPDWEERLRRLLGEELLPPTPRPAPPVQPAPPLRRPPIVRRPATPLRPPPVEVAPVMVTPTANPASAGVEETVRRFEQMDPAVMTPVRPLATRGHHRSSTLGASLRKPQAARQAFVASLVFGPPKGLED